MPPGVRGPEVDDGGGEHAAQGGDAGRADGEGGDEGQQGEAAGHEAPRPGQVHRLASLGHDKVVPAGRSPEPHRPVLLEPAFLRAAMAR
jgi:hypothetical protein